MNLSPVQHKEHIFDYPLATNFGSSILHIMESMDACFYLHHVKSTMSIFYNLPTFRIWKISNLNVKERFPNLSDWHGTLLIKSLVTANMEILRLNIKCK